MVYLKACPRCHGDLIFDQDGRVRYLSCLQCGHVLSGAEETTLRFALARQVKLTTAAPALKTAEARLLRPTTRNDDGMAIAS